MRGEPCDARRGSIRAVRGFRSRARPRPAGGPFASALAASRMPAVRARHSNPTFDALENAPQVLTLIFAQLDTQDLVRAPGEGRWLEAADADEVWKARCADLSACAP